MSNFAPVHAIVEVMTGFPHPWWISGGWAIDLFLGEVTRTHEDVEVGIYRRDQEALRVQLSGWKLYKVDFRPEGNELEPWEAGDWQALPAHQIFAARPGGSPWDLNFFLNDLANDRWVFRRDDTITRPVNEIVVVTPDGIPCLAPEIQLAYKAKHHRPKDEHDFERALGCLTPARRAWLKNTLEVCHPQDPWISRL